MRNLVTETLRLSGHINRDESRASNENGAEQRDWLVRYGNVWEAPNFESRFLVEARIGCGSSFEIYACTDPTTDTSVTVKVLRDSSDGSASNSLLPEVHRLIAQGADVGLCLSSQGRTQLGPYYAINGDRNAALAFMLGGAIDNNCG